MRLVDIDHLQAKSFRMGLKIRRIHHRLYLWMVGMLKSISKPTHIPVTHHSFFLFRNEAWIGVLSLELLYGTLYRPSSF